MNDCDTKKPSTFITYLDMNNLYGWVMSKYLPYGEFKWLKNVDGFAWCQLVKKRIFSWSWPWISWSITWITQRLSTSSRKLAVSSDTLSNYCKIIADKYKIKVGDVKKIITNLGNKRKKIVIIEKIIIIEKTVMIEKDCDDWKGLWWLKKIVIIEKDCDDWKRLWINKFMLVIRWI